MTTDAASDIASDRAKSGPGPVPYIIAVLSVTPVLGVLFGLIALFWGLATLKRGGKTIAILGAVGLGGQSLVLMFVLHFLLK